MATAGVGSLTIPLSDVLSKSIDENDIKIIDYVVDGNTVNSEQGFTDQTNSAILVELCLYPSIFKLQDYKISGYELTISGDPEYDGLPLVYPINFHDDFKDVMDVGEFDFDTIAEKLLTATNILYYEGPGAHTEESALSIEKVEKYVHLNPITPFTTLAKSFLLDGESIDDTVELQMPIYATPSAKLGLHAANIPNPDDPPSIDGVITYQLPHLLERISLLKLRTKYKAEAGLDSEKGYMAEKAVVPQDGLTDASIVVGDFISVSSSVFESKRRFEIPKSVWGSAENITFSFTPVFRDEEGPSEGVSEPERIEVTYDHLKDMSDLFLPEIPPSIEVFHTSHGRASFIVRRGDPATKSVTYSMDYYNANTDETKPYYYPHTVQFDTDPSTLNIVDAYKVVRNHQCMNFGPFITTLTAAAITDYGSTIGTQTIIPTISHPEYNGSFIEDNVFVNAYNHEKHISITIDNSNYTGAIKVLLYRETLSVSKSSPKRIILVGQKQVGEVVAFNDYDVVNNHRYRYYGCILRENKRDFNCSQIVYEKVRFSDECIVDKVDTSKSLYIPNIQMIEPEPGGRPTFIMNTTLNLTGFDRILSDIKPSLLVDQDYLKEVVAGKESLESYVVYILNRLDHQTGITEFLGHFKSGTTYAEKSTDFELRNRYTYIFSLAVIPPKLILDADKAEPSGSGTDIELFSKSLYSSLGVLYEGVEKSTFEISNFKTGQNVSFISQPILQFASLGQLTASKVGGHAGGKDGLKLMWTPGLRTRKKIKSYYVICDYMGSVSVLATIPGLDAVASYFYVDTEKFNEIGEKKYYIIGRLDDNTFTDPSNELTYFKAHDVTPALVPVTTVHEIPGHVGIKKSLGSKLF